MAASLLSRLPRGAVRPADLMLIVAVVAIVALLILPLPTIMIDMLVATNIAIGLLLLLSTLHVTKPLDFSTFPTVLLLSTLFRLSLSIATTRMILTTAEGGHIIQQFGEMVAGGNLIVGLVVFLIITVVQFIVISKGAERVAEVAARFSLDAMPGKQLSIDSDLRSGLIGKDEARERRRTLELESKLHGSLDGAMKFVKGDAIASIVIVLINLVGGLAVGVFSHGMEAGEAMQVFRSSPSATALSRRSRRCSAPWRRACWSPARRTKAATGAWARRSCSRSAASPRCWRPPQSCAC